MNGFCASQKAGSYRAPSPIGGNGGFLDSQDEFYPLMPRVAHLTDIYATEIEMIED